MFLNKIRRAGPRCGVRGRCGWVGFYVSHRLSRHHHHHYYQHLRDGHKDFLKDPLPSSGLGYSQRNSLLSKYSQSALEIG